MIKLVLPLIFICSIKISIAQDAEKGFFVGNVISDSSSCQGDRSRFGLVPILKSEYAIEIRFIHAGFRSFSGVVLYYDSLWAVKTQSYDFNSRTINSNVKEVKRNLDSLFSELVSNNIFSLPDQSDLTLEKYYYNPKTNEFIGEGMGVGCGSDYIIEFKIGDNYRRYHCSAPELFAEFYPGVSELKNYERIVQIFDALIKE